IEVMRVERIVEIEHPRLNVAKRWRPVARSIAPPIAPQWVRRLFPAIFPDEKAWALANHPQLNPKGTMPHRGRTMRRAWRKSMPFVWALLIGTLAGGFVAALAVFAAHN